MINTNKILSLYFLLTALLLMVSCTFTEDEEDIVQVNSRDFSEELKSVEYSFNDEVQLLNPGDIVNIDDRYLVISDSEEEAIFKVFSLPELEFLYTWGKKGRGPDEFEFVPLNEINSSGNRIIMYDISSQMLFSYSVQDTTFSHTGNQSLSYQDQTNVLSNVTKMHDSLFVADYGMFYEDTNNEHILLQPDKDIPQRTFGNYPLSDLEGPERYFEFMKSTVSSQDAQKIAAFYQNHNRVKLYDYEGEEIANIYVEDEYIKDVDTSNPAPFQYRTVHWASGNYLYVMGIHEYTDVIQENIDTFTPSLEVWNWEGEQVYRAKFDTPIHNFTVSEEHGKIYAYSIHDMDKVFVFDIPSEIEYDERSLTGNSMK